MYSNQYVWRDINICITAAYVHSSKPTDVSYCHSSSRTLLHALVCAGAVFSNTDIQISSSACSPLPEIFCYISSEACALAHLVCARVLIHSLAAYQDIVQQDSMVGPSKWASGKDLALGICSHILSNLPILTGSLHHNIYDKTIDTTAHVVWHWERACPPEPVPCSVGGHDYLAHWNISRSTPQPDKWQATKVPTTSWVYLHVLS